MITATEVGLSMIKSSNYIIFHLDKFNHFSPKRYSIVEQLVAFYILKAAESYKNKNKGNLNQTPAYIANKIGVSTRVVQRVIKKMDSDKLIISNKLRDDCDSLVAGNDQPVAGNDQPVAGNDQPVAGNDQPVAGNDQPVAVFIGKPSGILIRSLQDPEQDPVQYPEQDPKPNIIDKNIKASKLTSEEKQKETMDQFNSIFAKS